jgi:hypothetical protein
MTYVATYINEFQFSTPGDVLAELRIGTVLACVQGAYSYLDYIAVAIYDAGEHVTRITVEDGNLTADLTLVLRGPTFVDDAAHESNLSKHDHSAPYQGGYKAFSKFTDDDIVDRLISAGSLSLTVANKVLGVNATGTALEKKTIQGTANRVTVDLNTAKQITISTPQDGHTGASPTYAGLKLTNHAGILIGDTDGKISALLPSSGNQVVRRNVANTGFESVDFAVSNCKDVTLTDVSEGHSLVFSGGKWRNALISGGSSSGGGTDTATVLGLIAALGSSSGSDEAELNVADLVDGGSTPIDADKLEMTWSPSYSIPALAGYSDSLDQLASVLKGIDNNFSAPHPSTYCPPPIKVTGGTSSNNITIQTGDYWLYGMRSKGSYQNFQYKKVTYVADYTNSFWMLLSTFNSIPESWYAVFVRSAIIGGTSSVEAIPLFRVNSVSYSAPWTQLKPGSHNDHTVENTDFISSDDQWNLRQLVRISRDKRNGQIYQIVDTENTNNLITLGGNYTSEITAGDWFFILPSDSLYYYCYVGLVRTATTDNQLVELERSQDSWEYFYQDTYPSVEGILHGSTPSDKSLAALVPPTAKKAHIQVSASSESSVQDLGVTSFRNASDGTGVDRYVDVGTAETFSAMFDFPIEFYSPCLYRHYIYQETDPADDGEVKVLSFQE